LFVAASTAQAFGFDDVAVRARELAAVPYAAPAAALPSELKDLSYDANRDIRFKPDHALWRREGLPFELMFFHRSGWQPLLLRIHEIGADGTARTVPFDSHDFDYGANRLSPQTWGDLGFAGFRVHTAINTPAYKDELVVFLGASYFRAVGAGQRYGLSARGLAIDTVGGRGEEFPRFSEFWVERPAAGAHALVVYALLESPHATGAYRFEVTPGAETVTDVRARLYLRAGITTLGVAPLTSMFLFGENQPQQGDFRPEVHDSDGLMLHTGRGEWLWRPLQNPRAPLTTSFAMDSLQGFGLMQRDRSFASYEDTEARYELRPSAWVTPVGDWGPGRVELLQLPTPDETNDNVVACWVPATLPPPGQPLDLAWRLRWQGVVQQHPPGAWVTQTRAGRGHAEPRPGELPFIVDFAGPSLAALPPDAAVQAVVTADANGEITEQTAYRNDATGGWRLSLRVKPRDPALPVELRAFLQHGNDTLSETWTNLIPPR
jgi:glucans biosynthesis protein